MPTEVASGRLSHSRRPLWPEAGLDVAALRAGGVGPVPLRQVVLKIAGRCDLACRYCYVYSLADTGWRDRPRIMAPGTVRAVAERIREHAAANGLPRVGVVFHGGEPLLAGPDRIAAACRTIRAAVGDAAEVSFALQTNAVRLDETMLEVALREGIRVSVSVDGDAATHDRWRVRPDGGGSHAAVMRALTLLAGPRYRSLFSGVLAVIDVDADPAACYDALAGLGAPTVDFLLPYANWVHPPRRPAGSASPVPYGEWLCAVFDRWFAEDPARTRVRILDETLQLLLGGLGASEVIGLAPVVCTVVETDGSIEQTGGLRAAYDGASATGRTVFDTSFDDLLDTPELTARQAGLAVLAPRCQACEWVEVCGGGHYAHRYAADSGFLNRSVYCDDLQLLFRHMTRVVTERLDERFAPLDVE